MKKNGKKLLAGVLASSFLLGFGVHTQTAPTEGFHKHSASTTVEGEAAPFYSATLDEIDFSAPSETSSEEVFPVESSIVGENGRLIATQSQTSTLAARSAYFDFYQTYGIEKAADVFYNGQALGFVDAFPLIEDGTTFVPLAVLTEAIGATVEYDTETRVVTILYKGKSITFELNDTGYYVNGGSRQELPNAIFTAKDRSMVPVRFITEALELSLYWNANLKQVIVADLDALKSNSDENFQLLNSFLTYTANQTQGENLLVEGDLSYEMAVNGKNIFVDVGLQAVGNDNMSAMNYDMKFDVDLSDFNDDIRLLLQEMSAYPEDVEVVSSLLESVSDFDLNYIFDMTGETLYLQSSLISKALPAFTVATGFDATSFGVDESTWFKMNLDEVMLSSEKDAMFALLAQTSSTESVTTVDDLIDLMMEMTRYYNNHDVNFYNTLEMMANTCSDAKFIQSGDVYKQTGVLNSGSQSVSYELAITTDGSKNVTAYDVTLTFKDGTSDSTVLTLSQPNNATVNLALETTLNNISMACKGSLRVSATQETAVTSPNSTNIFSMSPLF